VEASDVSVAAYGEDWVPEVSVVVKGNVWEK